MKQKRAHDSQIVRAKENQVESWWAQLQISIRPRLTRRLKLYVMSLFCCALLCVLSNFAIILKEKRELVALLLLSCRCLVTVNVLWLFLSVLWDQWSAVCDCGISRIFRPDYQSDSTRTSCRKFGFENNGFGSAYGTPKLSDGVSTLLYDVSTLLYDASTLLYDVSILLYYASTLLYDASTLLYDVLTFI